MERVTPLSARTATGAKTLSDAAREANLSRNHFQSLLNRSLGSMVEVLSPKEPGRKPKPQALNELEQRLKRLERENSRLKKLVADLGRCPVRIAHRHA